MATMNPILRLRRALRSTGSDAEQADETVSAIDAVYLSRKEFEERLARMFAEHRRQLLLEIAVIVGLAVAIIVAVN